ncbi:MAG: AAA family ATPase [Hyphomicrobiaceae bacterium]
MLASPGRWYRRIVKCFERAEAVIVHLNGWPGAGKKTIGEVLARKLGARFIHNHMLHDVAIACTGFDSSDRWPLYDAVRAAAYAALVKRPQSETIVMTNGLCKNAPREQTAWRHVVDLAVARVVPLIPVVLEVSAEEISRRVESAERKGKKLSEAPILKRIMAEDILQMPDVPELLVIDATPMSPADAASAIERHLIAIGPSMRPATQGHLRFK